MKKTLFTRSLFWGLVLILTAAVLILDGIGISFGQGITPVRIIFGILLLALTIYEIVRLKFSYIFFPLAFLFLLFEEPLAWALGKDGSLISNRTVLLAALLLTIGAALLSPKQKGIKKIKVMGNTTLYFDASDMSNCRINDNMGQVYAYVVNKEAYVGGGVITVTDNLGSVVLHIPSEWNVITETSDNLGKISIPPQDGNREKSITLIVTDNVGVVSVVFD